MERVRTKGVSRDLTSLYKQKRSELKATRPAVPQFSSVLPPDWVDVYEKVTEDLNSKEEKGTLYSVTRLKQAHSERLKITFGTLL
jgi:hypothetical protein